MACKVRLWNPQWKSDAIPDSEVRKQDIHGKNHTYIEIFSKETSGAAAELGTAADSVLDGTTTPLLLYVESDNAKDAIAGVGTRKVRIIGVSVASATDFINGEEDPVFSLEEVNMAASAHTLTVRYYLRIIHFYASDWGSEKDTAGTLTLGDDATPSNAYLTIAAAANESNGSIIYGAPKSFGRLSYCYLGPADVAFNNT